MGVYSQKYKLLTCRLRFKTIRSFQSAFGNNHVLRSWHCRVNWTVVPSRRAQCGSRMDGVVSKEVNSDGEFLRIAKTDLYKISMKAFSPLVRPIK